jgi:hypothetical protein
MGEQLAACFICNDTTGMIAVCSCQQLCGWTFVWVVCVYICDWDVCAPRMLAGHAQHVRCLIGMQMPADTSTLALASKSVYRSWSPHRTACCENAQVNHGHNFVISCVIYLAVHAPLATSRHRLTPRCERICVQPAYKQAIQKRCLSHYATATGQHTVPSLPEPTRSLLVA